MSTSFEDLRILKTAEEVADAVWKRVVQWDEFPKDVVGKQMTRSTDSIGANIAESFGRFNFGEKLQFLYSQLARRLPSRWLTGLQSHSL